MRASPSGRDRVSETVAPALLAALRTRTGPQGVVPFDRFMEVALYGSGVGYYGRARSPFGPHGDFYTAPHVHPLFGRTLAARVREVREALGRPRRFRLVDLGCGDGTLLAGVLRSLGEQGASEGVEAVAVERTAARRTDSAEVVASAARETGACFRSAASLSELGPGTGVVIAHELLDAQPARRLRWDGSLWRELGFREEDGRLVPAESELVSAVPPPPLPVLGKDAAGTVLEVSAPAEAIVREVADHLEGGLFVVVDYGADERELLVRYRSGTLAAVRSHRSGSEATETPGEADLSVFVNFTRVRAAAEAAGLALLEDRGQVEALGAWGFARELERAVQACRSPEEEVRVRLAAKNLLFGFGTFRILELAPRATVAQLRRVSGSSSPASP